MFQKDTKISLLLDFYGDLLPDRKREMLDMYYNDDLSLSEISEECGITRQGVRDSLKKSEKELLSLEEKLGIASRFEKLKFEISSISETLEKVAGKICDDECVSALKAVIERLNALDI